MARPPGGGSRSGLWAGLALLAVLLVVVILAWGGWRSGLLAARPGPLKLPRPTVPALPVPSTPDPHPAPLRPGPGV